MSSSLFWALAAAAFLNLDRLSIGPNGLNRPLFVGLVVGLILQEPMAGLYLGLCSEAIFLPNLPLGGVRIPNGSLALASSLAALSFWPNLPENSFDSGLPVLVMAVIPPLAHLMSFIERFAARWGAFASRLVNERLEAGRQAPLAWLIAAAATIAFSLSLVFAASGAYLTWLCLKAAQSFFPPSVWEALAFIEPLLPLVCLVFLALHAPREKFCLNVFIFSFFLYIAF
ncbi:MAG: PTS sugar transporter subunit IIC [Deltaproteobacteria bacterium]|jgi:mannose/fructose/N-acetylgalactosamine-specific phosphotransferase system component IIC|nr:PTS sugar transporter subunit IIC [Deltaproteobacteria bacterium]